VVRGWLQIGCRFFGAGTRALGGGRRQLGHWSIRRGGGWGSAARCVWVGWSGDAGAFVRLMSAWRSGAGGGGSNKESERAGLGVVGGVRGGLCTKS